MRIGVIGTRGFPEIQGGIETHCMELYTRIASLDDHEITIYRRKPYITSKNRDANFKNIKFVDLLVPNNKYLETFLHSFFATIHALFTKYDIVHYHNTGPGFFIPLLKLKKVKIVFTYHNVSYTQKKWNNFAKMFLSLSEKVSVTNADFIVFISEVIKSEIERKYKIHKSEVIFNGVSLSQTSSRFDYLDLLGLEKYKYIIAVGRFLEEKGFDYLIQAFIKANIQDYKLVLVGDTDYPTDYSIKLKSLTKKNNIILTGFIRGSELNQIYSFAKLFVIPSFAEGLPIALLEAMSYNLDVLASDIPANLQVGLNEDDYFKVGDENSLKESIIKKLSKNKINNFNEILNDKFNWDKIARTTNNIYEKLCS
jgi:starch synthase